MRWSRVDYVIILVIIILAGCLRFPRINYPNSIVFDERASVTFVLEYLYKRPYFDVHPPFAQMFFSAIAGIYKPAYQNKIINHNENFGDFPYLPLRIANAVLGCLIPVIVYILAKLLYKKTSLAVIPAWLVIWDNALVLYSRLILPENLMLFLGVAGVMLSFAYINVKGNGNKSWKLWGAGILLGAAISVKWIALGFVVMAIAVLLMKKKIIQTIGMTIIVILVHVGIWIVFFSRLPVGSNIPFSIYEKSYIQIEYPSMTKISEILKYLPIHLVHMFGANTVYQQHEAASYPWEWVLGLGKIPMFVSPSKDSVIVLSGNQIGWLAIPGALIFGWTLLSIQRENKWLSISKENLVVIILGYVIFIIPFLFVGRVVFLYHYLSALLCGYLMVPILVEYGVYRWGKWLYRGYMLLVMAGFLLTAPVTYAWVVWSPWLGLLSK